MDCESRPAEQWKAMKNLFPWITAYHLTRHGCTDPSHSFRMTTDAFLIMTPFPPIVILNGGKNVVWERRKTGQWHRVKNLSLGWHLTVFLTTVIDPSRSFRMTTDAFLIMTPYRPLSFWMDARMLFEKDGKRNSDTEWRIYYSDDVLPSSSPR